MNIFKRFDEFDMRLRELTLDTREDIEPLVVEELASSQQSNYLLKLTLLNTIPEPIDYLINMAVLKTLIINCYFPFHLPGAVKKSINFGQLVMDCPDTLTSLTVDGVNLWRQELPLCNITSIKHLTLQNVELTSELASCIENCCPELLTLDLYVSLSYDVNILLQNHQLDELTVAFCHSERDQQSHCTSKVVYVTDVHTLALTDRTSDEWNFRVLQLVCPSVNKLSLPTE
jgi:hypothetical protein